MDIHWAMNQLHDDFVARLIIGAYVSWLTVSGYLVFKGIKYLILRRKHREN
jgi:hypothetical protein